MNDAPRRQAEGRGQRVLGLFTLAVAVAWGAGALAVADYVRGINSARVVGALMTGSLTLEPALPGGAGYSGPMRQDDGRASRPAARPAIARQVAFVEAAASLWLRVMLGIAAIIGVLGLLAAFVRRPQPLHVLTAACLLAATAGTLIAMRLLVEPDRGGLPPLPLLSYLCVGLVQSSYGCVLLAAAMRRSCRPASAVETAVGGSNPATASSDVDSTGGSVGPRM